MSAPPSPRTSKKDRPAALALPHDDRLAVSDGDAPYNTPSCQQHDLLPALTISLSQDTNDEQATRSASVSSALDPYYFGIPESPDRQPTHPSITPDRPPVADPVTPARNPAAIDRRGLVGVGELATPRWVREPSSDASLDEDQVNRPEDDAPDSPWTIEAIDGELDDEKREASL